MTTRVCNCCLSLYNEEIVPVKQGGDSLAHPWNMDVLEVWHAGWSAFNPKAPPLRLRNLLLHNGYASDYEGSSLTAALASWVPHLTRLLIGEPNFRLEHLNGLSSLSDLQELWVKGNFICWRCLMDSHVTALRQLRSLSLKGGDPLFRSTKYTCPVRAWGRTHGRLGRFALFPTLCISFLCFTCFLGRLLWVSFAAEDFVLQVQSFQCRNGRSLQKNECKCAVFALPHLSSFLANCK